MTATVGMLITHAPSGLGVVETVVLLLLPNRDVIGALIVFRVVYFLVPLAIGSSLFVAVELARRSPQGSRDRPRSSSAFR